MGLENRKMILEVIYGVYFFVEMRIEMMNGYDVSVDVDLDLSILRIIIEVREWDNLLEFDE